MKRVLLVTNSFAGSVSARAHEVIEKALSADFKLESETTRSRDHATELGREAVERGFDAVVAYVEEHLGRHGRQKDGLRRRGDHGVGAPASPLPLAAATLA